MVVSTGEEALNDDVNTKNQVLFGHIISKFQLKEVQQRGFESVSHGPVLDHVPQLQRTLWIVVSPFSAICLGSKVE